LALDAPITVPGPPHPPPPGVGHSPVGHTAGAAV